jgi:hypothetical protein
MKKVLILFVLGTISCKQHSNHIEGRWIANDNGLINSQNIFPDGTFCDSFIYGQGTLEAHYSIIHGKWKIRLGHLIYFLKTCTADSITNDYKLIHDSLIITTKSGPLKYVRK